MPSGRKKVIVRTTTNGVLAGYLPLAGIVETGSGKPLVELLDLEGRIVPIALASVRWIAYVRDFNVSDRSDPERLTRRTFLARPRAEGLWLRLTMADGELLEGLAPLDVSLADGLVLDQGISMVPPDIRSNTQRLYVPRSSFSALEVVAVVTTPSKTRVLAKPDAAGSLSLFPDAPRPPD